MLERNFHFEPEETVAGVADVQARHVVRRELHLGLEAEHLRDDRGECSLQDRVGKILRTLETSLGARFDERRFDGHSAFTEPISAEAVKGDGSAERVHV